MAHIAADVVLLPDRAMTNRVIEINRQIVREYSAELVLNERDCLPHISLAMGCIEEQDIERARSELERLARDVPLGQLTAAAIHIPTHSQGAETALLAIERTNELQALHERVMEATKPLFSHDAGAGMFHDDALTGGCLDWVRSYPQKSAYEQFRPHITLGYGRAKPHFPLPATFTAARLALCHLGNHCTCRRVLVAVGLDNG
jgi:2'-5' RNA ligase